MNSPLRIGTRGSALALAQTRLFMQSLQEANPQISLVTQIIKTTGDAWSEKGEEPLPTAKGIFTKELENALLYHTIDVAVHSLKDMPIDEHEQLRLGCMPPRADARDVLITKKLFTFEMLPKNPVFATGSPRRQAQLLQAYPEIQVVPIRGNLDTRLRKLRDTKDWTGIVIAAAGLDRLKPDLEGLFILPLDFSLMLPAPGQGCLALQIRYTDKSTSSALAGLHDPETAACVTAERAFLQGLGGGCLSPVGAYAHPIEGYLELTGIYYSGSGLTGRRGSIFGPMSEASSLGRKLASRMSS
jgi:hydroxymethylbilane synthase